MLTLDLTNAPRWHDLAPGVRVQLRPLPVRFDTDVLDVTLDLERLGSITSIPLLELRR